MNTIKRKQTTLDNTWLRIENSDLRNSRYKYGEYREHKEQGIGNNIVDEIVKRLNSYNRTLGVKGFSKKYIIPIIGYVVTKKGKILLITSLKYPDPLNKKESKKEKQDKEVKIFVTGYKIKDLKRVLRGEKASDERNNIIVKSVLEIPIIKLVNNELNKFEFIENRGNKWVYKKLKNIENPIFIEMKVYIKANKKIIDEKKRCIKERWESMGIKYPFTLSLKYPFTLLPSFRIIK